MSDVLTRRRSNTGRYDLRRLAATIAVVLVASGIWHLARPHVIHGLALSSVGCSSRSDLIGAVVGPKYSQYPYDDRYAQFSPWSDCGRTASYVAWAAQLDVAPTSTRSAGFVPTRFVFVDGRFDYLGSVCGEGPPFGTQPGDRDGDGRLDVTSSFAAFEDYGPADRELFGWVVVRLDTEMNEVAGLVLGDRAAAWGKLTFTQPAWRDEDGDGQYDFTLAAIQMSKVGGNAQPPAWETVARFAWDKPGGILVPKQLPDDGSVLVWTPPDGRPHAFSADALVDAVCRQLLPVPDDFGLPAATAPTSSPSTAPTAP